MVGKITFSMQDYIKRILNPTLLKHIKFGSCDDAIVRMSIEEIYDLRDNDVKNAVLDRLKVIDGMDLPRVASK